ncbi:MAG: hypothetical protein HDR09_08610 [Lachnospiraceae bacterium]|nr:hypothetical protein [Lachnospiraceae bacterium]
MNRKRKISGKDIFGYLFLGISVVMLLRSLMLCFSNDIWYDELFTVGMIEHSYGDLIAFTARDVHPPLYYCIVKFIIELCKLISVQANAVVIAKVVSVLPYFILFAYSVTFIRRRFGIFTCGLFLFCAIAMPQLSAYTVEVRMYSFALLFVTAAFLHAYGTITAGSATVDAHAHMRQIHAAALVGYGLAAAYTQYFACVAVIMVYLYVLIVFLLGDRNRIKEWLLWAAISVAGYIPWLYALFRQITTVRENYWILPLTWRSLGGCVKFVMKPAFNNGILSVMLAVVMFAICALVFVYGAVKVCHYGIEKYKNAQNMSEIDSARMIQTGLQTNGHSKEHSEAENETQNRNQDEDLHQNYVERFGFALAGVGVLIGLVVFGFVASALLRPIFVYRYMIPALGCFWLGFAVVFNEMWEKSMLCKPMSERVKLIFTAITICLLVIGLRDYWAFMGEEEYKILLMQQTGEALSAIAPDDIVIYNFDQVQAVTSYYMDDATESYLWCGTPETLIQEIIRPYDTVEDVQAIKTWCEEDRRVWFIGSFNSREDIIAEWEADGLHVEETGSYLLERYWFNLYKIF